MPWWPRKTRYGLPGAFWRATFLESVAAAEARRAKRPIWLNLAVNRFDRRTYN